MNLFTYDTRGMTAAMVNPLGHRTSYGYDADARNITETNPLGQVKTNTFDNDSRLIAMSYAAMPTVSYGYDPRVLVTLIQDQVGSTTNTWDACGQLTLRQSFFGTETMQYDPVGNRTLYQGTSGTRYTTAYDPANRETTLTFGSKVHAAQYDVVGQPTTETYSSGTQVRRGYDSRGYMTTLIQDHNSGPTSTIISTYDAGGRKTLSVRDGVATTNTYDNDDRLTVQNRPGFVASYAYDQDTNLTSSHHQGSNPITFTNNSFGQVTTQIQGSTVTTNTWDNAGRNTVQTSSILINRTWDQEGRMVEQQPSLGQQGEFLYRHDNLRIQSSANSVTSAQYVWDNGSIRRIIGSQGNDFAIFNGAIVEGTDREFLSDELGHITAWSVDESIALNLIEYWPYGDVQSGTLPQEGLGYMGAYSVTRKPYNDLLYAQQRWLKPSAGRFLSVDPYWPGELAYMYANGMPTMGMDSTGNGVMTPVMVGGLLLAAGIILYAGVVYVASQVNLSELPVFWPHPTRPTTYEPYPLNRTHAPSRPRELPAPPYRPSLPKNPCYFFAQMYHVFCNYPKSKKNPDPSKYDPICTCDDGLMTLFLKTELTCACAYFKNMDILCRIRNGLPVNEARYRNAAIAAQHCRTCLSLVGSVY